MLRSRHCALTKIMRTATSHASDAYDAIQPSRTRQRQRKKKRIRWKSNDLNLVLHLEISGVDSWIPCAEHSSVRCTLQDMLE